MINLLVGRSGSGKSTKIIDMIKDNLENGDSQNILIIPEQQSVVWQRRMAEILPASANLRFEISDFTALSNNIYHAYGGMAEPVIDDGSRLVLVWRALMSVRPSLRVFAGEYEDRNLSELIHAIDEFKHSGITPEEVVRALDELEREDEDNDKRNDALIDRLSDVALVYGAYESILHREFVDRADLLNNLSKLLEKNRYFEGKNVFIDSFFSLTSPEEKILYRIMEQAENVTLSFPCPPASELSQGEMFFEEIFDYLKSVKSLAARAGLETRTIVLKSNLRHTSEELANVEKYLFDYSHPLPEQGDDPSKMTKSEDIRIITCSDRYDEAEACASIIESLHRKGYRNSEIAVIAGEIGTREGIIDTVLRRHGIACFISEPKNISSTPAVRMVLAALKIAYGGWQQKDIIRLIKTGMLKNTLPEDDDLYNLFKGDMFETYTATWNIRGRKQYTDKEWTMNPDGYSTEFRDDSRNYLSHVNEYRKELIPSLEKFVSIFDEGGTADVRTIAEAIIEFAEENNISEALNKTAEEYLRLGITAEAERTIAGWNAVCEVLDRIVEYLGSTRLDAKRFAGLFARVASTFDRGSIPPGIDEVILASASNIRFDSVKCVIILGSQNGEFPAEPRFTGFFSEQEKIKLETVGMILDSPDGNIMASRSYFDYYHAAVSAGEKLFILTPTPGEGSLSDGAQRIRKILFELGRESYSQFNELPLEEVVFSEAGAEYQLSRRSDAQEVEILKKICSERGRKSGNSSVPLKATGDMSGKTESRKMTLSNTMINTFVKCKFNYACQYKLGLRPEPDNKFNSAMIGTFIHHVLEKFFMHIKNENIKFSSLTSGEIDRLAAGIIDAYLAELAENSGVSRENNGRITYLFTKLQRYVPAFLKSLVEELVNGKFIPVAFETPVGSGYESIKYMLEDETEVTLKGIIDRVDVFTDSDGRQYFRIIDYKTGSSIKKMDLEHIKKGLNMQLLIYMFTIQKFGLPKKTGLREAEPPIPAGAEYIILNPRAEVRSSSDTDTESVVKNSTKRVGLYLDSDDVLDAFDGSEEGRYRPKPGKENIMNTLEQMGQLYDDMEKVVCGISKAMKEGRAEADPMIIGDANPCAYCTNRFVCRSAKTGGMRHGS